MRKCSLCKTEKPLSEFHKRNAKWYSSHCKPCRREYRKAQYAENPFPVRERSRKWREENPEKAKETNRLAKERNKEKIAAQQKAWRAANIDRIRLESRAKYAANREMLAAKAREWRARNPEKVAAAKRKHYHAVGKHRAEFKAGEAARRILKRTLNQIGKEKVRKTTKTLGYGFDCLKQHLERNFCEGMSWENYGEWHVDHIVPVAEMIRLGITCPKKINALKNLRPAWSAENIAKRDKFELVAMPIL